MKKYHTLFCQPGLDTFERQFVPCKEVKYPLNYVAGTTRNTIRIPSQKVNCDNIHGEAYVFLSCTSMCYDAVCPLRNRYYSSYSCTNIRPRKIFSISKEGRLVFVQQYKDHSFSVDNIFECSNKNCLSYEKICDLVDDCGDGSDEENCRNHFQCVGDTSHILGKQYIPKDMVCDGKLDYGDHSDESKCGKHNHLIYDKHLVYPSWVVGILAVLLNSITSYRNIASLKNVRSASALNDRLLIIAISIGDLLIGIYLITVAALDAYFGDHYCSQRFNWLVSSSCSALGMVSTIGSELSLFAMMMLSFMRFQTIMKGTLIPMPVNKISVLKIAIQLVLMTTLSIAISYIPLMKMFEDRFVNALYFPEVKFLKEFATKKDIGKVLSVYYGNFLKDLRSSSWNTIRQLVHGMFTNDYGGVDEYVLNFYGDNSVCIFKYFVRIDDAQIFFVWTMLSVNLFCFAIITFSYVAVNIYTIRSSSTVAAGNNSNDAMRNRNRKLQRKVSIIITTDFLCWIPFTVVALLHLFSAINATSWYSLFSIIILPINSVINPLIYDHIFSKAKNTASKLHGKVSRKLTKSTDNAESANN